MKPTFFKSSVDFRTWLARHHANAQEVWVGFYKPSSGRPSITWPEAVDQALCFGWIDGVRKRLDDTRYTIRFTPRRQTSIWSTTNIRRVGELTKLGLMHPAGRSVFAARDPERSGRYAYEQQHRPTLSRRYAQALRANKKAWTYFQRRPPWYRRTASHWVMHAKKEETRRKRLATLIEDSARGRTIAVLTRPRD